MLQLPGEGVTVAASELTGAVAVLSAMITPAVLISACGSLAISTANRLGRSVERTRKLSSELAELSRAGPREGLEEYRAVVLEQMQRSSERAELLQRAMARLYLAISLFVATSVAIGLVAATRLQYAWLPIGLGLIGAGLLLHASLLLITESRINLRAIRREMEFMRTLGQRQAPGEVPEPRRLGRRRGLGGAS